tara:strand:+ start:580 stop:726 length:147 start_codon:yes stop_codon:yes gene_type:complete
VAKAHFLLVSDFVDNMQFAFFQRSDGAQEEGELGADKLLGFFCLASAW